jgi:hypothetical protein
MFSFTHPAVRAATAAATLLGTIVLVSPLSAASGDLSQAAAMEQPYPGDARQCEGDG